MSEKLLGCGPLGQGGGIAAALTRFAPAGPYYLINDTFTTDRAAGSVNGTNAEPGPGRRTIIDSNSKLSLTSGALSFATGGAAGGDPGVRYGSVERTPGRLLVGAINWSAGGIDVGFDADLSGGITDSVRSTSTTLTCRANGTLVTVGSVALSTTYQVAIVQRAAGAVFFIKGGAFSNWTLIWVASAGAGIYPAAGVIGTTTVGTVQYLRLPATLWLPAPIVSDGFGATILAADGLGHAEGVAGGLGSGGDLYGWLYVGTWQNSGGLRSASALSSGSAIAYIDCSKADIIATVKLTRSGGDCGLLLRFVDGNNFVSCRHDGTNVLLIKKVAGSNTTVQSTAATYVAGAELRVIATGSAFRVYYNNALVGSEQTIADAALQSGTSHGLYTTNTGNTFDDLVIRARGTGGEYSALDGF